MVSTSEIFQIVPLIIIGASLLISIILEMYFKSSEKILPWFSAIIFIAAAFYSLATINTSRSVVFHNMLSVGGNSHLFYFIFNIGAALVCMLSIDYIKKYGTYYGEYYILVQSSVLGMMLMAAAKDLLVIFIGLEIMSVSFYVLAGLNRKRLSANEASLKYFLLGAFATGFVVYGISLIYGTAKSTSLDSITANFSQLSNNLIFITGVLLFLIGFSFKIAAFPFHMWVPDVYQGSPTTVAGLFSTGGKAAAFSAILLMFSAIFNNLANNNFIPYLSVIAVLSMFVGSIIAIAQDDIKRMLAYSSIAHAGYLIIGLAAGNVEGSAGIIFYLAAYTFMNLGAFGIVALIEGENETNLKITSYSGLAARKPLLSSLLALMMFSLSGIPPFAGFFGKYYIFISAVKADLTWLAVLGAISSAISVYFYLRIVVLMYFKEADNQLAISSSKIGLAAVIISSLLVLLLGIFPGRILELITSFV